MRYTKLIARKLAETWILNWQQALLYCPGGELTCIGRVIFAAAGTAYARATACWTTEDRGHCGVLPFGWIKGYPSLSEQPRV